MADGSDRIALPIRVHEFLLTCAGRVDDDALTDARELLAVAELDRAVDLLAASLVAGRVPLTSAEHRRLRDLVVAARGAPAVVDRIPVDDAAPLPAHRFTAGTPDGPGAEEGVAEAVFRVLEVLPDIRSVSCVWRTTPAGAATGPVPQRIVLVEIGSGGFPPSTAYRIEQVLRRAGLRSVVEALGPGAELTPYHRTALAAARRLASRDGGTGRPAEPEDTSFADPPAPRPASSTRRRSGAHADKRATGESSGGRRQQRLAAAELAVPVAATAPPAPVAPAATTGPGRGAKASAATDTGPPAPTNDTAGEIAQGTDRIAVPPESRPAAVAPVPGQGDTELSKREQELLRQLHEELAKREQSSAAAAPGAWQTDRAGGARTSLSPVADWQQQRADHQVVNGRPSYLNPPGDRSGR